ncbi:MAG TPA: biopolymer transporter ExbD [Candidatus Sulfotelmatobacter sp.]|nr:biopolymer transporter ExbD [Candidatus Sulfotelmatobacter sp.]
MTRKLGFLVAAILTVCAAWAQNPAPAPPLQQGISVDLAKTEHGVPAREADNPDAWVVTITREGRLYFRANQTTPEELLEWMKAHPRNRDAKFYIKADSLTPFANVQKILDQARVLMFDTVVLLTSQPGAAYSNGAVSPMGLEVQVGAADDPDAVSVQIIKTTRANPIMRINNQQVPASAFPNALSIVLQTQKDKKVIVHADGQLPFTQIAHFMDTCRAAGATLAMTASK